MCFGELLFHPYVVNTHKEIFLSKMRRYGIRSAILTILQFWRNDLKTKEAVKQIHLAAPKNQRHRILSEDLESFYTSLQNPERQPNEESAYIFLTEKLTEKELTLLENRDDDFLNAFPYYRSGHMHALFKNDMEEIEESSDPGSIFSRNYGHRDTIPLNVTPQPMQEVANEDLLDIELKKQGEK